MASKSRFISGFRGSEVLDWKTVRQPMKINQLVSGCIARILQKNTEIILVLIFKFSMFVDVLMEKGGKGSLQGLQSEALKGHEGPTSSSHRILCLPVPYSKAGLELSLFLIY